MAPSRPPTPEEQDIICAGPAIYVVERAIVDGQRVEVIRILDDDKDHRPIYISSDEEEVSEAEVSEDEIGVADDGEVEVSAGDCIPPVYSDEEDEDESEVEEEDEDEDEDSDDEEDWSDLTSEDSGYDSMTSDEEHEEDEEDEEDEEAEEDHGGDDVRPRSPLVQQFPPRSFWHGWRPFGVPPPEPERPEDLPPVSVRSEDSASPASALSSSTKRSREESDTPQVGMKRLRKTCDDSDEDPRPSTSGLSTFAKRRREDVDTLQVGMKRLRMTCVDSDEDPRPSTSGLSTFAKRRREDVDTPQVGMKRLRKTCDDSNEDPRPSTSGLSSSTHRRYWSSPSGYPKWPDDSDSDED